MAVSGVLQLVRDVGDEIAPDAFQPFEPGDIVQDHQRAAMGRNRQRRGVGFEYGRIFGGELQLAFHRFARRKHARDQAQKRRIAHQSRRNGVFSSTGCFRPSASESA